MNSGNCQQLLVKPQIQFLQEMFTRCLLIFLSASLFPNYLEAIERHKESQNVVGALKDTEDSQVSHDPLDTSVLRQNNIMIKCKCLVET